MKYKGIIFDFNGTLFFDSDKHEKAWNEMSKQLRGKILTDDEIKLKIHGRNNTAILKYLCDDKIKENQILELSDKKEEFYRNLCLEDLENFHLVDGAEEFLDFVSENNIPRTIATSSGLVNLNFYIDNLKLEKWFDIDSLVYDDGTIKGKPSPDIYLKAAKKINLEPKECIVFEDAVSGIESAFNAGIGKIIAIADDSHKEEYKNFKGVNYTIKDFSNLNTSSLFD